MIAFLTLLPFALGAFASPIANLARDEPGPWCNGLGPGAFDIAYNFTLGAYNSTLPNSNSTGAPVVMGQAGAVDGASFKIFSVCFSNTVYSLPRLTIRYFRLDMGIVPVQRLPQLFASQRSVSP